jgi:uncharacterized protein
MNNKTILEKTKNYVQTTLQDDTSGHDWWHVYRVWQTAKYIAKNEKADLLIVELAALLHDIADWKFNDGDLRAGSRVAKKWLAQIDCDDDVITKVCNIIDNVSFKGANVKNSILTLEGQIVQDADRLDAMGAIGISRAFAYGGFKRYELHNPETKPILHDSFEAYKNNKGTTINHFYEKLLLLKDRMNTATGKLLAAQRHQFMVDYLEQFFTEWNVAFDN